MPPVQRVDVSTPEKDVIVHDIEVTGPLRPKQYFLLAEEQRQSITEKSSTPLAVPVYEFYCSFRTPAKTVLATVHYRCRDDDGGGDEGLKHHETRIYEAGNR